MLLSDLCNDLENYFLFKIYFHPQIYIPCYSVRKVLLGAGQMFPTFIVLTFMNDALEGFTFRTEFGTALVVCIWEFIYLVLAD